VIAEMIGNHNQSLKRALAIVEADAYAGAHAIKRQTYTTDTMPRAVPGDSLEISDHDILCADYNLHDLYQQAHHLGVAGADHGARTQAGPDLLQLAI
jgi:N-acetylneuraminate synthase